MFIRRTITNSRKTDQAYYTYRLVEGVRTGSVVKQTTLLNLGSHFDVPQADWPALAARIDDLLHGAAAVGSIIGRIAHPGSELATHVWLQKRSALGELIEFDFEAMDLNRLYRASDALYKHRDALQDHLFEAAKSMFGFADTVTLYDL